MMMYADLYLKNKRSQKARDASLMILTQSRTRRWGCLSYWLKIFPSRRVALRLCPHSERGPLLGIWGNSTGKNNPPKLYPTVTGFIHLRSSTIEELLITCPLPGGRADSPYAQLCWAGRASRAVLLNGTANRWR